MTERQRLINAGIIRPRGLQLCADELDRRGFPIAAAHKRREEMEALHRGFYGLQRVGARVMQIPRLTVAA